MVATIGYKLLTLSEPVKGQLLAKLATRKGEQQPGIADVRGDLLLTRGPAAIVRVV